MFVTLEYFQSFIFLFAAWAFTDNPKRFTRLFLASFMLFSAIYQFVLASNIYEACSPNVISAGSRALQILVACYVISILWIGSKKGIKQMVNFFKGSQKRQK